MVVSWEPKGVYSYLTLLSPFRDICRDDSSNRKFSSIYEKSFAFLAPFSEILVTPLSVEDASTEST